MPSSLANSGIAPAFWIARALQDSSSGMPSGLTLRRIDVSTVKVDDLFPERRVLSAVRASEVIATTLAAISALTRVDMSGGRATRSSASFTFFDVDGGFELLGPLRAQDARVAP